MPATDLAKIIIQWTGKDAEEVNERSGPTTLRNGQSLNLSQRPKHWTVKSARDWWQSRVPAL